MPNMPASSVLRHLTYILGFLLLSACSTTDSLKQSAEEDTSPTPKPIHEQPADYSGMWLLPQIKGEIYSQMRDQGLSLSGDTLYSSTNPSLHQAVVRININGNLGGTGSFVSGKGLILTNYRNIHNALSSRDATQKKILDEGFYADSTTKEISIPHYTIFVPIEQKEVTEQLNRRIPDTLTYQKRQQHSQKVRRQLIAQRKNNNDDLRVTIDDFWSGNRQFMSVYKVIRDVRLVHIPPESIGNFGGQADSRQWPHHAAGYAFLRAYVGPDGSGSAYQRANVPFNPGQHLAVSTEGISAGDFTMMMGYPGQTSRHESSYALEFYHHYRNPIITDANQAMLEGLQYAAAQNAGQRRSVARTLQYYRQVQQQIDKHNIIEQKRQIEKNFKQWVKKDSLRHLRYGRVLSQLDQAYDIASQTGDLLYAIVYTLNNNRLFEIADLYHSYRQVLADSTQQEIRPAYTDSLLSQHKRLIDDINLEAQSIALSRMIQMLATLPEGKVMFHLIDLFGEAEGDTLKKNIEQYINTQRQQSILYNLDRAKAFMRLPVDSARAYPVDDLVKLYRELLDSYRFSRKNFTQHVAYQHPAQKRYVEGMQQFRPEFARYPDANGTLRLSTGRIKGYSPRDGIYYIPTTTLEGMLTKNTGSSPFDLPKFLKQYSDSISANSSSGKRSDRPVSVNFLSTNDMTDGSSGSPILNDNGELIGLNIDNNPASAASDYMYDPNSRAINLDLQFMLFLMSEYTNNKRLLDELMKEEKRSQY